MPRTIKEAQASGKWIQLQIPLSLHADLKKASRLDRRSMVAFTVKAIEERVAKFLQEDVNSRDFTPPGLR